MQVIVLCVCVCAQLTSGTSPSARIYLCTSCVFFPVVLAARQRSHLWSCFTVHSSGFSPGKIAQGTPSSFSFTFSFFFLSIPPSILLFWAVLSPLKHSAWLPPCQCLHLRPSPLNNPINLRAPSSGPRLSLFSEVSYWICFQCDVYKLIESAHARDARMVIPWTSRLQLPLLNSKSCNRLSPFKWKPPNMIRNLCCNTNHTNNYLT